VFPPEYNHYKHLYIRHRGEPDPGLLANGTKLGEQFLCLYFDRYMSIDQEIYDRVVKAAYLCILIALMTVTQNVCLKKGKKHKNYLYTQSNYFLCFCCLYLQTFVVKNAYFCTKTKYFKI